MDIQRRTGSRSCVALLAGGTALCAAPNAFSMITPSSNGAVATSRAGLRGATAALQGATAAEGDIHHQHIQGSSIGLSLATCMAAATGIAVGAARRRGTATAQPSKPFKSRSRTCMLARGGATGKKKILVMGGTRFIGCYLVAALRKLGHEVFILNRGKKNDGKPEPLPGMSDAEYQEMLSGVTVLIADRKEPEEIKKMVIGAGKFDVVFDNNARKITDVEPLVEAIEATGGCDQFIFMSSAGVYGPTDVLPLTEKTPGDPNSRHKEKLGCENLLDARGFNWTSIRPVYIYGPLNYNPVERFFFDRVSRDRPVCIPFEGRYITQLGHCEDLADFMCKCVGNPAVSKQAYNISGEDYVTFAGMAQLCAEAAGKPEPKIVYFDPKKVDVPEGFPKAFPFRGMHFFASIKKAKQDVPDWALNFSLLEGLKSSYQQDYVARGFNSKEVDFRTDDLIIAGSS